jgi:ABC-type transport system substrate-binding protein
MVPELATDWKVSSDAKSITLTLRKGVKFHDGSDFNAAVAKWNLDNYKTSTKPELKNVTSVDIIDDYTIRLNLSAYDSLLLSNLGSSDASVMISKKAFDTNGQAWMENNPVGTGPFKFASWTKDVAVKFGRFDDYWGGKPYLDGVEIDIYADTTTASMALQRGEIDILHVRMVADAQELAAKGFKVTKNPTGPCPFLVGDSSHSTSPYSNLKVRQAVSYAIDIPAICKSIGAGIWPAINQWAYPGSAIYNSEVVGYPYNPDKAKQLLAEAGYPNGFNTKLNYLLLDVTTPAMTAVQGYLKAVGINADLQPAQFGEFTEVGSSGKGWDNGLWQVYVPSYPDMLSTVNYVISPNSPRFVSFERPAECQEQLSKILAAPDEKTKVALSRDLEKMLVDKYCMGTWLWIQSLAEVKSTAVRDDKVGETPQSYYVSSKAWLNK